MPKEFEIGNMMSLMISMGDGEKRDGRTQLGESHQSI
jgi:hypothetical protein